jgi:hypothetical protein
MKRIVVLIFILAQVICIGKTISGFEKSRADVL